MPAADAAELVRRMTDRYRLPDALRRADTLAWTGPPAATMTDRQPDWPTQTRGTRQKSEPVWLGVPALGRFEKRPGFG